MIIEKIEQYLNAEGRTIEEKIKQCLNAEGRTIEEKIKQCLNAEGKAFEEGIAYEVGLLARWAFSRQFMMDTKDVAPAKIRLSAAGRCPRSNAYKFHGYAPAGKEMDGRSKLTFFAGDLCELVITQIAKLALKRFGGGCLIATGRDQATIKLPVNGAMIEGHPDGLYLESKEILILECKSMSSFRFREFERGIIGPEYLGQLNSYLECLGLLRGVFIAYNKDANVLAEQIVAKDEKIVDQCRSNILAVLHSTKENLPPAPPELGPDKDGFYDWRCLYCQHWKLCRPNAEEFLVKGRYKLREKNHDRDRLRESDAPSGDGPGKVGPGVREVQADRGKPGRPKKNRAVRGNVEVPGRAAVEGGSEGESLAGV